MNMPSNIKEANGWFAPIIGAVVGGVMTFIVTGNRDDTQQMKAYGDEITVLKVDDDAKTRETQRLETDISSINQALSTMSTDITVLKNASENQSRSNDDLKKRFDDLDAVLRPLRPNLPGNGGR
jgi:septal ring factor EnvC (AmiA/AmiB activator)